MSIPMLTTMRVLPFKGDCVIKPVTKPSSGPGVTVPGLPLALKFVYTVVLKENPWGEYRQPVASNRYGYRETPKPSLRFDQ